jgi:hypothetical protein
MKFSTKFLYFLFFLFVAFIFNTKNVLGCEYDSGCAGSGPRSCEPYSFPSGESGWLQIVSRAPDASCEYGWNYEWYIGADCGGCNQPPIIPKASINGYITLNGGGRAGPGNLTPSKNMCGSAYGGVSCLSTCDTSSCPNNNRTCCWNDFDCVSGTCTPVLGGIDITNSEVGTGWWCPTEIYKSGGSCCGDCGDGSNTPCDTTTFCRRPINTNNINFSMSGMTVNQAKNFNVTGVPVGYTCDYTFTINGTPTSGTGCSFPSPSLPEGTHSLVVNLREAPPPPPEKPACAYGSELLIDPYLTNTPSGKWGFWNGGNASYSFASGGMAKLISIGNGSGGLQQQILGLAGKNIFIKAALRRKSTGSASNPYTGFGVRYATGVWEYNYPSGIIYYPSSSDAWEIVGNSTSTFIPNNVDRVQPGASIWTATAGDYYVGWVSICEEEPKGIITGSVVNDPTGGYLKSSAVCTMGTALSGLNIGFGGGVLANVDQCAVDRPYYTKTLTAGTYTVTANVPVGWEALSWGCTSIAGGVDGTGTSCPGGTSRASGDVIAGNPTISLKNNETASIWFWIQPIAPSCKFTSGVSQIIAGDTVSFVAKATVVGSTGTVSVRMGTSPSNPPLLPGTLLSPTASCNFPACSLSIPYATTGDMEGTSFNIYCQGYNGAIATRVRECRPAGPFTYPADVDCDGVADGAANNCTSNTGTDCMHVDIVSPPPWYQVWGGDVHAKGGITSFLPILMASDSNHYYFNLNAETSLTGFPGLISHEDTYDFTSVVDDPGTARSSKKQWLAKSNFLFSPSSTETSAYNYFLKKLGNPAVTPGFNCSSQPTNSGLQIVRAGGDCSISGNWNFTGTAKVIVLVDGKLSISGTTSVANGAFLAFIVKGNIEMDGNNGSKQAGYGESPMIQGVFMTDSQFNSYVGSANSGRRFIAQGIFYANEFVLNRNLKDNPGNGARNWNTPAELFIYRPDLAVNSPSVMWPSDMDWQEVAP